MVDITEGGFHFLSFIIAPGFSARARKSDPLFLAASAVFLVVLGNEEPANFVETDGHQEGRQHSQQ